MGAIYGTKDRIKLGGEIKYQRWFLNVVPFMVLIMAVFRMLLL